MDIEMICHEDDENYITKSEDEACQIWNILSIIWSDILEFQESAPLAVL